MGHVATGPMDLLFDVVEDAKDGSHSNDESKKDAANNSGGRTSHFPVFLD